MTTKSSVPMKVILGAMTIGNAGYEMARIHTAEDTKSFLDTFQRHGHNTIDTARVYSAGSSEEILGSLDIEHCHLQVDTKLYPTALRPTLVGEPYHHTPEDLRRGILKSLETLKVKKIGTWYLHGPDRTVPWEDTLRTVNQLHTEGYFENYGISNYQSWEIARICDLCEANGWLKPSVCQGIYNAFHRMVEDELFPCLRHYGISFYAYNPLAGGFLTNRYHRDQTEFEPGSRMDPQNPHGKLHQARYLDGLYFDALELLRPVAAKHGLSEVQCALRWVTHHSKLKQELGDGILIGASSSQQLEENLIAFEQGQLPQDIVDALDAGFARIRGKELKYWH